MKGFNPKDFQHQVDIELEQIDKKANKILKWEPKYIFKKAMEITFKDHLK